MPLLAPFHSSSLAQRPRAVELNEREVVFSAIRAQGAGGQHVNKVSSAVHARFDICASSLPDDVKIRLLALADQALVSLLSAREREGARLVLMLQDRMAQLRGLAAQAGPLVPQAAHLLRLLKNIAR